MKKFNKMKLLCERFKLEYILFRKMDNLKFILCFFVDEVFFSVC